MKPMSSNDFQLYPEPSPMDPTFSNDAGFAYQRPDFMTQTMTTFDMNGFEAAQYNMFSNARTSPGMSAYDEAELQLPSSNLSTASAPSASSSAVGSPESHHGQLAALDWTPGLGVQPGIVGQGDYFSGTEYSTYQPDLTEYPTQFDYQTATVKNPNYVGELAQVPRSSTLERARPLGSFSSTVSSACTVKADPASPAADVLMAAASPISPVSSRKSSLAFVSPPPSAASFSSPPPSANSWSTPSPTSTRVSPFFSQSSGHFIAPLGSSYPTLIHPEIAPSAMNIARFDATFPQTAFANGSPAASPQPQILSRGGSQSPYLASNGHNYPYSPYPLPQEPQRSASRPPSFASPSYTQGDHYSDSESKEKQRCLYPDCGKTFKDLKAHMLTHQNERPEKCPITNCDYHIKGFARKYDKNRHTLTHYKGTMVCGFCPGSGSAAEKSFNRADVFKRHLTAVHGVEQTPPNSRKKVAMGVNSGKKLTGYPPDATGKCSTCTQTFSNAQDFYEHLDDCVLRIVQQEDPAEAINAQRLAEVENDRDVHQTLEKNNLPVTTQTVTTEDDEVDEDMDEDDTDGLKGAGKGSGSPTKKSIKTGPPNGIQKSKGLTHSRGGVQLTPKNRGRKHRRDYPSSWGFDKGQMTMKKRIVAVFDGPRRLAKDDMMLSTDHEVRVRLSDGKSYVTDLDVQTLKRAQGFHGATDEEKGPWISDDPTEDDLKLMKLPQELSSKAAQQ